METVEGGLRVGLQFASFQASLDQFDVVRKRVSDPADPSRRFERAGFGFQVFDSNEQPVGGEFKSDSTGRH